ncbi:MAG: hypothetical protein FD143_3161, partial [Ignavibacteria bacterium]
MSTSSQSTIGGSSNFQLESQSAFRGSVSQHDFTVDSEVTDLRQVLLDFQPTFYSQLEEQFQQFRAIKVSFIVTIEYQNTRFRNNEPFYMYLRSSLHLLYQRAEIPEAVKSMNEQIMLRNENFMQNGSNLQISKIFYVSLAFTRFAPLAGSGYRELPEFLDLKRAIINVKNTDNRCFGYAILSAIHPLQVNAQRAHRYLLHFAGAGLDRISYPVEPTDVPMIEEQLNLKINIFSFYDDTGKARYPLYVSKREHYTKEIDLLYWGGHYAWIKKFSAFIYDLSPKHSIKFFCKRCFGVFLTESTYTRHQEICSRPDFDSVIYRFPPPGQKIKFTSIKNQLRAPFIIVADFECLLEPIPVDKTALRHRRSHCYSSHTPCSVGFYILSSSEANYQSRYYTHTGPDVVKWFLENLEQCASELVTGLKNFKPLCMTQDDWASFNQATQCWICQHQFDQRFPELKVRDHDHLTGQYRGAAHSICNLQLQQRIQIPVFFHNLRGYDGHLIARATELFPGTKIRIIGQGFEKYLSISFGPFLVFKDSFQFLGYSLEQLCTELAKSGVDRFQHLKREFPLCDAEKFQLLLRKGVYPYEYMDNWEKLDLPHLPNRDQFFNSIKQAQCDEQDYAHAERVWQSFDCHCMRDYMNLYLKTDVLILADVFENFRKFSLENYRLDPVHYVSSPQFSWDAMLLYTGCEFELISDPAMFHMLDHGLRGGVSMIIHRYAKANNPEMGVQYDSAQPLAYITYLDANNLYGHAMSQSLPIRDFHWL